MQEISKHMVLVKGDNYKHCEELVLRFFANTSLVRYDHIDLSEQSAIQAVQKEFFTSLNTGITTNKDRVAKFISELQQTGISTISELADLEQGYPSKSLHILSHFLDGFIGVDSHFYNLLDDSHWVSENRMDEMESNPDKYWLLSMTCFSLSPDEATLLHH